jgi:hypothetical protein
MNRFLCKGAGGMDGGTEDTAEKEEEDTMSMVHIPSLSVDSSFFIIPLKNLYPDF